MRRFTVTVLLNNPERIQTYTRYGFDILDIQRMEMARYQNVTFISLTIEEV